MATLRLSWLAVCRLLYTLGAAAAPSIRRSLLGLADLGHARFAATSQRGGLLSPQDIMGDILSRCQMYRALQLAITICWHHQHHIRLQHIRNIICAYDFATCGYGLFHFNISAPTSALIHQLSSICRSRIGRPS